MLYTQFGMRHLGKHKIAGISLLLSLYFLSLGLQAADKIIIPKYDDAVFSDGTSRWNFNSNQEPYFILKKMNVFDRKLSSNRYIKTSKFDRQNDQIPMTFSIYTNGSFIYQEKGNNTQLWSFERTTLKFNHRPTLFVSFQQVFF